jgi:hypothetical protein
MIPFRCLGAPLALECLHCRHVVFHPCEAETATGAACTQTLAHQGKCSVLCEACRASPRADILGLGEEMHT